MVEEKINEIDITKLTDETKEGLLRSMGLYKELVKCKDCEKEIKKGIFIIENGEIKYLCNNKCSAYYELNKKEEKEIEEECEHKWIKNEEKICINCGKEQQYIFCKECRFNGKIRNYDSVMIWCFKVNIGLIGSRKEGYCEHYKPKKKEEICMKCNVTLPLEEMILIDYKPKMVYSCKDCEKHCKKRKSLILYPKFPYKITKIDDDE